MAQTHHMEGLIVRKVPYRDTDLILSLLTQEEGKVTVFAAGARRSQKRFGPYLDLFAQIQLVAIESHGRSMLRLKETHLVHNHMHVRTNLFHMAFMTYYTECLWNLIADHDPHPEIYAHALGFLKELHVDQLQLGDFFVKEYELLTLCGHNPIFDHCSQCGVDVQGSNYFSYAKGGLVCAQCRTTEEGMMLDSNVLEGIRDPGSMTPYAYKQARDVLAHFVRYTLGKVMKSHDFRKQTMWKERAADAKPIQAS